MNAPKHLKSCLGLALLFLALAAPSAQASFGLNSFSISALDRDGSIDLRAGSHPYEYIARFSLNQDGSGQPEGRLRDVIVDLPPGLIGNPRAIPSCTGADFEGAFPACPVNTQIGVVNVKLTGLPPAAEAVYNLTPPSGVPASIGFSLISLNSFQEASIRTGGDYGVTLSDITVPSDKEIQSINLNVWGVPADGGHDPERGRPCLAPREPCPVASELFPKPFLTLPTSCAGPLKTTIHVDSVEEPSVFQTKTFESLDDAGNPAGLTGCERPPFDPTITTLPETSAADSPTGLHVNLHLPQTEDASGIATAHLKDTVLSLPKAMVVNPSSGAGLVACSEVQVDLSGPGPANCPESSKVGAVSIETPLLDHPVPGAVYLAKQGENPFGSLLALYIAVDDPTSGVVVKLAGKVEPDPVSGQLKATFRENPQLPFEDLDVDFFGGPRATLTTPFTCGTYTSTSDLTPWTTPEGADAFPASAFQINSGANGAACPASEAAAPNAPSFEAGTVAPLAGSYSPFVLKLSRENGYQHFGALNLTLPPGLTGKLAGVQECSEAQIAQAQARSNPGEGALEEAAPSCPQTSALGTVIAGAGSGAPLYVSGHAYLAGPYKGAPLSMVIVTPAVAGPLDLGVVAIRSGLYIDESTSQITVKSDPLPTILQGIPLDIRSVAVKIDRSTFTLNPTNCEAMAVSGQLISTAGQAAPLKNRFQVDGCKGLDFKPKLAISLKGKTQRGKNPALKAVLTQPSGQANIRRVSVVLPRSEFIDNRHINNPCTRVQFNAGAGNGAQCPPSSILGRVRAFTPLLDKPLEGPVYFRSNGGERELPDLVASLDGQVHLNVVGFIDSVGKKGSEVSRIRNTFATVPDAPVSKFVLEMAGGKKGLLLNSTNLCKVNNIATVKMDAQNGKRSETNQKIANSCSRGRHG